MEILINPASILAANPTQLLQTYQNIHASSEDPASQVLQRHMIGVTTHQSYTLTVRHDSDRTRELKYQVGDIFIFPAGASHWAAWQDSYGSILSIDVALFDRHMQQFLEGKKFHLRSQFQIRDPSLRNSF
ncbi:MAG: hypothetical protein HC925_01440 [Coleofasciculaceae cyanobacterium SM2_3_26]|nr:hypothetical protein [Coleofasciculaceae cyanobacterium SM2_3_26]